MQIMTQSFPLITSNILSNVETSQENVLLGFIFVHKPELANGVSYIPTENKNTIWCKLDRNYFGFKNDIYLGTVFLSPPNYERNNNDDLISEIEAEMLSFSQKGGIIVQGDYNARTGDIQEVVMNDDNTFLPVPEDYEIDSHFLGIRRIPAQ